MVKKAAVKVKGSLDINRSDRFKKLKDGWVKDNLLGIDWAPASLEKELPWNEGMEYAKKFGRLPSDFELSTLVDRSKYNPAVIDAAKVLELKTSWYWSGVTTAWGSVGAWCVYFYGGVSGVDKGDRNYVRPVRSSK
jgi:hypothetical protein